MDAEWEDHYNKNLLECREEGKTMSRAMYNSIDPRLQLRHKQNSIAGIATQVYRYRRPKGIHFGAMAII